MTPLASFVLGLLQLIATALPGYLALLTGHATDAEALEHARARIAAIPVRPAGDAIDDEVARATKVTP